MDEFEMSSDTNSPQNHPEKPVWLADRVALRSLTSLKPYARNSRTHSPKHIEQLKTSVATFGFVAPILIDEVGEIIAGHGRFAAAKALGLEAVPTVVANHLTSAEVRALRIADNRLAELSEWDREALQVEFADLVELGLSGEIGFDLDITGFELPEIDLLIAGEAPSSNEPEHVPEPEHNLPPVTQPGDLWVLEGHRLYCGDALEPTSLDLLLDGEVPRMVFTDPPYNVPVNGHVRAGAAGHREFAMASGEMSEDEFRTFLASVLEPICGRLPKGGIAMVCMDWRHIEELIASGKAAGFELINLCVWNKTNGGMGSLYRSKHELVAIFRKPGASHINNVELGVHGRNRTNVWDYAGVNSFGAGRDADLADHPTVKPTALVADAIMDVSHRGDIVLDVFGGSGATLLAAEKTGRLARLVEIDPRYVDVAIRRWQEMTGKIAVHAASGESFDERASRMDKLRAVEVGDDAA